MWTWHSQPFIKDQPAGNILVSAATLFSGSTPTKVFCFLKCLQVATFTDQTFYEHQTKYLEPAIISVWKHKQQNLLAECVHEISFLQLVVMVEQTFLGTQPSTAHMAS